MKDACLNVLTFSAQSHWLLACIQSTTCVVSIGGGAVVQWVERWTCD